MTNPKFDPIRSLLVSLGRTIRPVYKQNKVEFVFYHKKPEVKVGIESYGRLNVYSYQSGGKIEIGNFTSINEIDVLMGGDHHRGFSSFPFKARLMGMDVKLDNREIKDIIIGHDCWIGHGATLLDGVTIGTGTVVGANSVVSRSTTPYSIVAGNPAREVAKRFDDSTISEILESKWWELPLTTILAGVDYLYNDNLEFLKWVRKQKK